jgi:uncharacterized protein
VKPVLFADIPEEGLAVDLPDGSWLSEDFQTGGSTPVVSFFLQKQERGARLTGEMSLGVTLQCDRCLDSYQQLIESVFSVDLVVGEPEPVGDDQTEYICSPADMDVMFVESAQIDLDEMARQQLYLQLPVKRICEADCPGLCQCGEKKGSAVCNCEKIIDSPFAALATLAARKD